MVRVSVISIRMKPSNETSHLFYIQEELVTGSSSDRDDLDTYHSASDRTHNASCYSQRSFNTSHVNYLSLAFR